MNDRLFLIGPRGSGKTTVGQLLAGRLRWEFVDADDVIETAAGRSVADVFAAEGEAGFRQRESEALQQLIGLDRHVIACGGGVVLRPENRQLLRQSGHCAWLTGDPATLCRRLEGDPTTAARRPALTALPPTEEMARILAEREPLYGEVAHFAVATDGRSPDEVVSAILSTCSISPSTCR
jgi:shikimate kinase